MYPNQSPRVLYIEDHEDTRELVTLVLEQKRYRIKPARPRRGCLKRVRDALVTQICGPDTPEQQT
jgi:CheY-like chemotaxis protein